MDTLGNNARTSRGPAGPRLSVIVPVRNGAGFLSDSLAALRASDLPAEAWELIVVDDASTDGTGRLAEAHASLVLRQPAASGPSAARNLGARYARGDILIFVDADVVVHADALRRLDEILAAEPDVAAVFGAYDVAPRAPGLVSQYRNLLHHRVHALGEGDAETFWAGCGAMRRQVFAAVGGFDEALRQLEDIELGYRVRALGHRIVLRPEIQGTHLKRWTLPSMITTDLFGRGVTWMRLHLEQRRGGRPGTLNLRPAEKIYTFLTGLALIELLLAAVRREPIWLAAAAAGLAVVLLGNLPLLRWYAEVRGVRFAVAIVPLRLLYYLLNVFAAPLGWIQHMLAPRVSAIPRS